MGNFNNIDPQALANQIAMFGQQYAAPQQQVALQQPQAQLVVPQQQFQQPVYQQPQVQQQVAPQQHQPAQNAFEPNYQLVLEQLALSDPDAKNLTVTDIQERLKGMHEAVAKRLANPVDLARFAQDMVAQKQGANKEASRFRVENETLKNQLAEIERLQQEKELTAVEAANQKLKLEQENYMKLKAEHDKAVAKQYDTEIKFRLASQACQKPDYYAWKLKEHLSTLEDSEIQSMNIDDWIYKEKLANSSDFLPQQQYAQQPQQAPVQPQVPQFPGQQPPATMNTNIQPVQQRATQSFASQPSVTDMNQANMNPQLAQQQAQQQLMQAYVQQQAAAAAAQQYAQQPAQVVQQQPQYQQVAQTGMVVNQVPANYGRPQIPVMVADVSKTEADKNKLGDDLRAFRQANGI